MDAAAVARTLDDIATLMSLKGENVFKVRAFQNAARAVEGLPDLDGRVSSGTLLEVEGIGKGTGEVITELLTSGRSTLRESLKTEFPDGVLEMLRVPGVGPKKALALLKDLGVTSLGELEYAVAENRLAALPGFGQKTQEKIAGGLRWVASTSGQQRLAQARPAAEAAQAQLLSAAVVEAAGVSRVELAGDVRRGVPVVSRIDLVVACARPEALPAPTAGGLPVRLVTAAGPSFGNAWLIATGSDAHLRALVEGGVDLTTPSADEESIYRRAGLAFVPPELREEGQDLHHVPTLVTEPDLHGVFHVHSTYSDGRATLAELFEHAVSLGHSFLGLSDHSPAAAYARGVEPERLMRQWAEIDALRPSFPSLTVFRGTEADILPDGSIDYGDDLLARFDFVIASVHSAFQLPREAQTARLVAAVRNPRVTMLGHATGRLLLSRAGIDVDLDAVLAAAGEAGTLVETNASPYRLELDWTCGTTARRHGVRTSINPDAHSLKDFDNVRHGVGIARKAGFSAAGVLNAAGADAVAAELARLRERR